MEILVTALDKNSKEHWNFKVDEAEALLFLSAGMVELDGLIYDVDKTLYSPLLKEVELAVKISNTQDLRK